MPNGLDISVCVGTPTPWVQVFALEGNGAGHRKIPRASVYVRTVVAKIPQDTRMFQLACA